MANSEVILSTASVYADLAALPDFATAFPHLTKPVTLVKPHPDVVTAPYTTDAIGSLTVPDATAADEEIALDLGTIATEVTAFVIRNSTGQDLGIAFNGALAADLTLRDGAVLTYAQPTGGSSAPITAISIITTATQVGDRTVDYRIFGDPS